MTSGKSGSMPNSMLRVEWIVSMNITYAIAAWAPGDQMTVSEYYTDESSPCGPFP